VEIAGGTAAEPGRAVALRAIEAYTGGQPKYEGPQGAVNTPRPCAARYALDDAHAMLQHGRALRLPGREGFFVANAGGGSTQQAMPTFLQWCASRRARGLPAWGCGMRALRLWICETSARGR
jgi:hypothetical protein